MRLVAIPPPANERHVLWEQVENVRYLATGHDRCIVLTYRGGGERYLQIHQALALWHEIRPECGCEPPCYFERDLDTAPETCAECRLCEALSGIRRVGDLRPAPIRQPDPRGRDWRNVAVVMLVVLCWLLMMLAAGQVPSPTEREGKKAVPRRSARV